MASAAEVVAESRLLLRPSANSSGSFGSTIGGTPAFMPSTLLGLTSMPTTVCPSDARQPAHTVPTYPRPKMLISMVSLHRVKSVPRRLGYSSQAPDTTARVPKQDMGRAREESHRTGARAFSETGRLSIYWVGTQGLRQSHQSGSGQRGRRTIVADDQFEVTAAKAPNRAIRTIMMTRMPPGRGVRRPDPPSALRPGPPSCGPARHVTASRRSGAA